MSPAAQPPAKKAGRVRKAVQIEQIGVDDYAGGKGTIKTFVLGAPDAGKTRWASAFPRPLYLACEPTVAASIVSRKINYEAGFGAPHVVRINQADSASNAMLDALDLLKKVNDTKAPGGLPRYQTAVLDTLDGYQRLLKDEWVQQEQAGVFTGRDAWGFIEAKMNLTLTRLMNLDMNVVILCHLQDKEVEEQIGNTTQKRTLYGAQLQGGIKDTIYNEFDLVGLMKRELVGDSEVRGISFEPTNTYPFLKDHFSLETPGDQRLGRKFWPITLLDGTKGGGDPESFIDTNYGALWTAIVGDLDTLPNGAVVEQVPEADGPTQEGVVAPAAGGPVAGATAPPKAAPAKAPAKAVAAATPPAAAASKAPSETPAAQPSPASPTTPAAPSPVPAAKAGDAAPLPGSSPVVVASEAVDPGSSGSGGAAASDASESQAVATSVPDSEAAPVAERSSRDDSATSVPTQAEAVATVQEVLGAEVIAEGDTVDVAVGGDAARDHGGCPICGKDMTKEQPDLVQLSRLKHRTLVLPDGRKFYETGGSCYSCYQSLNEQKASTTGLYAAA